ncbi:MAG: FdtA/QdtA family cupin domain-containing protein [Pseudomonadota bacterium]
MLPNDCQMIQFPKITDARGNLSFVENNRHVPFDIKRVYYLYDVPAFSARGGHAHKQLKQVLISLAGSFKVHLDNGSEKAVVTLNKPWEGLLIMNQVWRELSDFSSGSTCLVLASEFYDENDYYRDYESFMQAAK